MKNKLHWVELAETIDRLRVFPRAFLLSCFLWAVYLAYVLLNWYMALTPASRGLEASGFASVVFISVMTFLKMVYQTYSDAGPVWGPQPASSTLVSSSTLTKVDNPGTPP